MIRALALAAALLAAAPAAADAASDAAAALHAFGRCVVQRAARPATALLATQPGSRGEAQAMRRLDGIDACYGDGTAMHQPVTQVRGAVASALLVDTSPPAPRPLVEGPLFNLSDPGVAKMKHALNEAIYGFGQCVVAAQPAAAVALATATPGTPAERDAIRAVRPALNPCLPSDAAMRLDKPTLRAVIAESVYMLTLKGR